MNKQSYALYLVMLTFFVETPLFYGVMHHQFIIVVGIDIL